jgi:N-acetylmuramoyl-L-alanine amidase
MTWRCAIVLSLFLISQFSFGPFARGSRETSEETKTEESVEPPTPTPVMKNKASKGAATVDIGTNKAPSPRPDIATIAKPPLYLDEKARSATTTVSRNFLVAIDVGHTNNNGGAISSRGVFEYNFNRRLGGELFDSLQSEGQFRSLLINPDGGDIGLVKRAQVANERKADLFLAIHHDSVKDNFLKEWQVSGKTQKYCDDFHGYSIFFSRKNVAHEQSLAFAIQLGEALIKAGFAPTLHHVAQEHRPIIDPSKGVYAFDDLLVLKHAKMPAVLLECGVIVNRSEEQDLNSHTYRARMVAAIESAISDFAATESNSTKANQGVWLKRID